MMETDISIKLSDKAAVLVVDDNALILQLVSSLLTKSGYKVSFATNGREAIGIAKTARPDLILLDVQMPEMDGYAVCGYLKQIPETSDIPIIFLTAKSETDDLSKGYDVGGVDYLTKPFNPAELLARVKVHVNLKRAIDMLREQKEQELRYSVERFEDVAGQSHEMIWEIDEDGLYTYVSPGCELIYGYQPEEMMGKMYFYDLHPTEGRESFKQALMTIFSFRQPFRELINGGQAKGGKLVWVITNGLPIEDSKGNLLGYRGADYNITERKIAEEALRESEMRYRSLIENAFDAIYLSRNGRMEYANQHFTAITGYSAEELLSFEFDVKKLYKIDDSCESSGVEISKGRKNINRRFDASIANKKGELIEVEVSTVALSVNGSVSELGIIRDISERNRLLREMKAAKEKAEEMNTLKSHFLALVSHELRTPLNGILGFAQILDIELTDPDQKQMSSVILKSSRRLKSTLANLLDLTRIEANKLDLHLVISDITELVRNEVTLHTGLAEEKGLVLNIDISDKLTRINADESLIKSIVDNLLSNACKYTDKGSITVKAYDEAISGRQFVTIEVCDTGIGIPLNKQEVIFEAFRQVSEGLNRSFEGTGLGLTITKRYTELLNGVLVVKSEPGIGSVFKVSFPAAGGSDEILPQSPSRPELVQKTGIVSTLSVLVVDDHLPSVSLIERLLGSECSIDSANAADEALRLINDNFYDLIIMDVNLGRGLDGIEVLRRIRQIEQYANIPVVAMTAYAQEEDKEEFLKSGFNFYISKPFELNEFTRLIQNICNNP